MGNRKLKAWVIPTFVLIVALIVGAIIYGVVSLTKGNNNSIEGTNKTPNQQEEDITKDPDENVDDSQLESTDNNKNNEETAENAEKKECIKGFVNTFSGYTSLFAANGGNVTNEGTNFEQAGLNVEIYIEDNDDSIIEAFKNGEIQFFAMTVNKMALVSKQLEDSGIETIMPFFLDTSTGGDAIVADSHVKKITDLKNVKIGMAKNSVSTAIPVWYLNISGLTDEEIQEIVSNFVLFDSTQEAVDAFINGEVGAVSTWNITGALEKEDSHILSSTSSGEYLVIDGLVFNKKFAESHEREIKAMADAILKTVNDINNDVNVGEYYDAIRQSVPDFSDYSNEELASEISYAKFLGFKGNMEALEVADNIYKDFCKVWKQLGYETNEKYELIDDSWIISLGSKWEGKESSNTSSFTDDAEDYIDQEALITQYAKVLFNGDSAEFKTGYEKTNKELIDEFIKVAKILNKTVIKISGHVNLGKGSSVWEESTKSYKIAPGFSSSEFAYKLSFMRAKTVKEYMVSKGIDEERIIIEGLGGDYPIDTNDTEEGKANNRSCEISFYQAGY